MSNTVILSSKGLNTKIGKELIGRALKASERKRESILIVSVPYDCIDKQLKAACKELGFQKVYLVNDFDPSVDEVDTIYIGEGNTYEMIDFIRENRLESYIRKKSLSGTTTYIGASAGAIYASKDFGLVEYYNEKNFVGLLDHRGLGLLPYSKQKCTTVMPHRTFNEVKVVKDQLSEEENQKYDNILSICDEEVILFECSYDADQDCVSPLKKPKRIRCNLMKEEA